MLPQRESMLEDPSRLGYSTELGSDGHPIPLKRGIIAAIGVGIGVGLWEENSSRAQRIQLAMTKAVEDALAEGLTEPELIQARILTARDIASAEE